MGVYYQAACDETKERIDPSNINGLGIKAGPIACPMHPFGAVVIFAMLHRWNSKQVRLVNDTQEDPGYFEYTEVTKDVLSAYNKHYETNLEFTG